LINLYKNSVIDSSFRLQKRHILLSCNVVMTSVFGLISVILLSFSLLLGFCSSSWCFFDCKCCK